MKHLSILGSTGSIGTQTLDVVSMHRDMMTVEALGCAGNIDLLERQIREFKPRVAAVYNEEAALDLRMRVADTPCRVVSGMEGLIEMVTLSEVDIVVTGIVGMIGIEPTIAAIKAGKDIALANKETCVCAGHLIVPLASESGVRILPVDSEHSAIFQSLQGRADSRIRKIILTASGGPFLGKTREELKYVTVREALDHPTWNMGPKVTVDSASLVNKGLEVMEARWLFNVDVDRIQVLIQPQSLLHSAVEYEDGSVIGQIGPSDMRIPIQYALTYPNHIPSPAHELGLFEAGHMDFLKPDTETFRGLPLAYRAMREGGSMPCVFNAAGEWANAYFRRGKITFLQMYDIIEEAMTLHHRIENPSVEELLAIREETNRYFDKKYLLSKEDGAQ